MHQAQKNELKGETVTYSDQSAGIVHGRLLLNLLQEGSLDVLVGLGSAGAEERHDGRSCGDM